MTEADARAGPYRPEASQILAELRGPFTEMRQVLERATPTLQEAHSLHYQLLRLPQVAAQHNLLRFTHLELWELHTQIALAGLLTRVLGGETTPGVLLSIGESIALLGYLLPRAEAEWRAFRHSPQAAVMHREVSALDRLLAADAEANRALQARAASIRPHLQALTGVSPIIPAGVALALRET